MMKTGKGGSGFFARVYALVRDIPPGKVMTYGQIARILGSARPAKTVGYAMHGAPPDLNLPCHRVVNKSGEMAPGNVFGGADRQRRLLKREGVRFHRDGRVNMEASVFNPPAGGQPQPARLRKKRPDEPFRATMRGLFPGGPL